MNVCPKVLSIYSHHHGIAQFHRPGAARIFTPSSDLVQGPPLCLLPSISDSNTPVVNRTQLTRATCPNHLKTFRLIFSLICSPAPTLLLTSSFFHLFVVATLHISHKHFFSITSVLCPSYILIAYTCAPHLLLVSSVTGMIFKY